MSCSILHPPCHSSSPSTAVVVADRRRPPPVGRPARRPGRPVRGRRTHALAARRPGGGAAPWRFEHLDRRPTRQPEGRDVGRRDMPPRALPRRGLTDATNALAGFAFPVARRRSMRDWPRVTGTIGGPAITTPIHATPAVIASTPRPRRSSPRAWSRSTAAGRHEVRALDGVDLDGRGGHRPRPARAERRRQDHDRPDPRHAAPGRRGPGDRGRASTSGRRPTQIRRVIGLSGQYAAVDENLTGRENLWLFGRLYHLPSPEARKRADELLEQFELTEAGDRVVKTYSGGMRRRLDLGAALIGRPRLLILDEPTTGLDPRSRIGMWDVIRNLVREGTTLLLTTQYLEEADELADTIAVVDHGKIIARGTSDELKSQLGGERIEVIVHRRDDLERATAILAACGSGEVALDEHTRELTVHAEGGAKALVQVLRDLDDAGIAIDDIGLRRPTLDDVFLALTGHAAEEQPERRRRRQARHRRREGGMTAIARTDAGARPPRAHRQRDHRQPAHRLAQPEADPAHPGARDLRDPPVDHVRAAVRVRVRRRDRDPGRRRLQVVPDARDLRPDDRVRRGHDGDRDDRRRRQGHRRPVPVAADRALGGAHRPDVRGRDLQRRDPVRADGDRASSSAGASTPGSGR